MANNSKKLSSSQSNDPQCWTFFSTAAYAKQTKVPQENIPNATAEKVKTGMFGGIEAALGLSKGSLPRPFYSRLQLWGAALPTNSPGVPCIFDPHGRAGICGDWLFGSGVESTAVSGMALANHIAEYIQSGGVDLEDFAVGLHNEFRPLEGHDIGQFPGNTSWEHGIVIGVVAKQDTETLFYDTLLFVNLMADAFSASERFGKLFFQKQATIEGDGWFPNFLERTFLVSEPLHSFFESW
ncbi:hypothetical protein LWI28_012024 [Acer negundo]|uniref:Uncharacterized protein n=1 Tax=Acer negundo TaxID=4023 RepID=A0AAD5J4B6_ACENE|nr:hypothetical protein LWI28_012024 [Acer negundo]